MTETEWFKGKDADAMLRLVGDHLSPRRWHLLACAIARRTWEFLPKGALREAVESVESNPGETNPAAISAEIIAAAAESARQAEAEILKLIDPGETDGSASDPDSHPAIAIFQAASEYAREAIEQTGAAVEEAGEGLRTLVTDQPGRQSLTIIRESIGRALETRAEAKLRETAALDLKARGEELADRGIERNSRIQFSVAEEIVGNWYERFDHRHGVQMAKLQKTDLSSLARFLHELVGNPFRSITFLDSWRTEAVVGIARAIDEDGAFDRFPILADALLDADCDSEPILRHCRGTEAHGKPPVHLRGCWVIDLILGREQEFFASSFSAAKPNTTQTRKPK